MTLPHPQSTIPGDPGKEVRTANWVAVVICAALLFDGYDLVVYGTVLPGLLADAGQIGHFDAATAGLLGSWALIGVLVGSLTCGAIGDFFGRRRLMLAGIGWFSLGMFATALATDVTAFGALRFATGLGLGVVIASAGATMAEFAPAGRRQFYNAIVYSGVPAGGVLASVLGSRSWTASAGAVSSSWGPYRSWPSCPLPGGSFRNPRGGCWPGAGKRKPWLPQGAPGCRSPKSR